MIQLARSHWLASRTRQCRALIVARRSAAASSNHAASPRPDNREAFAGYGPPGGRARPEAASSNHAASLRPDNREAFAGYGPPGGRALPERLAIFMAGLPASGKTELAYRRYGGSAARVLDLDEEIRTHPSFDPEKPHRIYSNPEAYAWADARMEAAFQQAIRDPKLEALVVDGTGTKLDRRIQRMEDARASGWWVKLLIVSVSIRTAVERNARRKRQVPRHVLHRYQKALDFAAAAQSAHADEVEVWWNEDAPSVLEGDFDCPLRYLVDEEGGSIEQEMGGESTAGQPRGVLAMTAFLRESQLRADLPGLEGPVERLLLGER